MNIFKRLRPCRRILCLRSGLACGWMWTRVEPAAAAGFDGHGRTRPRNGHPLPTRLLPLGPEQPSVGAFFNTSKYLTADFSLHELICEHHQLAMLFALQTAERLSRATPEAHCPMQPHDLRPAGRSPLSIGFLGRPNLERGWASPLRAANSADHRLARKHRRSEEDNRPGRDQADHDGHGAAPWRNRPSPAR